MGRTRETQRRQVSNNRYDWYVYMVRCADGSLYTGITRDLEARVSTHNKGTGAKYTRGRLPVSLIYAEAAADRATASQREMAIKKLSRPDKISLISSVTTTDQLSAS
jgi:putative endonuclease